MSWIIQYLGLWIKITLYKIIKIPAHVQQWMAQQLFFLIKMSKSESRCYYSLRCVNGRRSLLTSCRHGWGIMNFYSLATGSNIISICQQLIIGLLFFFIGRLRIKNLRYLMLFVCPYMKEQYFVFLSLTLWRGWVLASKKMNAQGSRVWSLLVVRTAIELKYRNTLFAHNLTFSFFKKA